MGWGRLSPGLFIRWSIILGQQGGAGVRSLVAEGIPFTVHLPRWPSSSGS
ncbi:MAG TPA: hypothetical protein VEU33_18720 [Archangium sp.]|nr:hypothetical protein [Archangium sp.]